MSHSNCPASPLSYLSGASTIPLIGRSIGDSFDESAEKHAEHEALIVCHEERRWSYGQLREAVDRCARGLMVLGIERGDRVGIWAPNRSEWTILQFATAKIGAILVNINPAYRTTELEYVVRHSGLRMLVFAPRTRHSDYVAMLGELLPELAAQPPRPDRLACERFPELQYLVALDLEE